MTRESKVGLVVACSFLILVGIVVASKWKPGEDASEQQEANKVAAITPMPERKDVKPSEPSVKQAAPAPKELAKPVAPGLPIQAIPAPDLDPTNELIRKKVALVQSKVEGGLFLPPPVTKSEVTDTPFPALPMPVMNEPKNATPGPSPTFPVEIAQNDSPKPLPPVVAPQKDGMPTFPLIEKKQISPAFPAQNDVKKEGLPALPAPEPKQEGGLTFPALPGLKKDVEPKLPTVVTNPENNLPTFPPKQQENVFTPPSPMTLPMEIQKEPSIAPLTNSAQPVFPGAAKDTLPGALTLPKKDVPTIGPNDLTKPGVATLPTFPESPPKKIPAINSQELPSLPSIATNPNNGPPTFGAGGIKPARVVEHTMNITDSKAGETTFAQLSTRLFGSDKYADALHAYNRRQTGNTNLPATIAPGQKLMYPLSADYLVQEYPNMIRTANPTIPSMQNTSPVTLVRPPVTITPPTTPSITPVSNPPAGQGCSYVVQSPSGERIRDIAQRTLGSADRWFEIYRINQGLNLQPQFPLPAGTRLQLPGN